ncbi:hypothetical protein DRQ18_08145 [bacterium]|nr:MAG: hypothetical protein DRQ18_08145 [bacterium]
MKEEKLRILKMVEEGKITAEEAERLLAALEKPQVSGTKAGWLKVRVWEKGKEVVKVNVPISLVKAALRLGGRFDFVPREVGERLKEHGVNLSSVEDFEELLDAIGDNIPYKLVEVEDEDERVEVVIE